MHGQFNVRRKRLICLLAWSGPAASFPEPATIALLSLGLDGLGFSRRKSN